MKSSIRVLLGYLLLFHTMQPMAQEDLAGAADHPLVPRIDGTYIVGYSESPYDEGEFVVGMEERQLQTETAEGKRTRIMYFGSPEISPLLVLRNYQKALADLGTVEEKFQCRKNECYANFPSIFIWSQDNRIPNSAPGKGNYLYGVNSYFQNQLYWYATVTAEDAQYHVSVYSTVYSDRNQVASVRGLPAIHLEIVENADFEPSLVKVTAAEMSSSIAEQGYVALYGIQFDTDSADLRPSSSAEMLEIAATLSDQPALKLYVVGHTDNQGSFEYNQNLSERRAQTVVNSLVSEHGIAAERLVAVGAGLIAPKATNDTDDGRAINRRVELVKQ